MRPDTVIDLQLVLRFGSSAVVGRHDLRLLRQYPEELSEISRREELSINRRLGGLGRRTGQACGYAAAGLG